MEYHSIGKTISKSIASIAVVILTVLPGFPLEAARGKAARQERTVTFAAKNIALGDLLWEIHKQTGYDFIYGTDDIKDVRIDEIDVKGKNADNVLSSVLTDHNLAFAVNGNTVTISKARKEAEIQPKSAGSPQKKLSAVGYVFEESGLPIIGASVILKNSEGGSIVGTVTGADGAFAIDIAPEGTEVVVSSLGYRTQNIILKAGQENRIVLRVDAQLIDELVITAYGTFKKSAYAGSASNLTTDRIKDVPVISFKDNLQGSAAGVQISAPSGQPGSASEINIRGMGSFNAGNQPLYVIDGVPVISGSVNSISSDSGLDIMSTISSTDIENMTIIKDAAAASLYGSRAANGVILITTKRGKHGKPMFSYKSDWGWSDFAMQYRPVMNGEQRREYIYNALKTGALKDGDSESEAISYADSEIDNYAPVPWCGYIDWDKILFKRGSHQNHEVSITGGTDKFSYYSSLS